MHGSCTDANLYDRHGELVLGPPGPAEWSSSGLPGASHQKAAYVTEAHAESEKTNSL